ncbi:MAG: tyrosine-type recombinase/integrase [Terriglobales bacterium]
MSLIKRGKYYHSKIMHERRVYWKSLRTGSYDKAVQHESIIRSELLRGQFGILDTGKTPTLMQFETRLLDHWKAHTATRTAGFYKQNLKVLNKFGFLSQSKLHKIDAALIEKFTQARLKDGVTPVTINHSLRTLRRILHLAAEWKLIARPPKVKMLPGENQREYVLDDQVVNDMVKLAQKDYPTSGFAYLLPFLVDTGLRISEACALEWDHITFKGDVPCSIKIVQGKSKYAKREIPLTDRAAFALLGALQQRKCEYAFTGKGGHKPMTRHWPSQVFREIRDALSIGPQCVLHSCRHTFLTRLGNGGCDAFTIQRLAGHSSITISQRYVHPDLAAKQAAIALLDALNNPKIQPQA